MKVDPERGLLVCAYCGAEQELPSIAEHLNLETETTSLCPTCRTPLSTSRLEGHQLLCCGHCFGMLIAMNRFATIIKAARAREGRRSRTALPRTQKPTDRVINCPTCLQPMLSHDYAGPGNIVIDTCERCQVNWLDAGELRRAAIAPDTSYSG